MKVEKGSFVTIFLAAQNVHCYKDVGMIPRTLSKDFGYKSYLVCRGDGQYDSFEELKLIKLGGNRVLAEIKLMSFLFANAKYINVLNLYHWGRHTYIVGCVYKFLNPNGKLYVKCDMDDCGLSVIQNKENARKVFAKIAEISDLISCESKRIANELNKLFGNKVEWVPNGFFQSETNLNCVEKEKIILNVGRLGTEQKATENLVNAFRRIANKIPDWKLVLVGGMTPEFEKYVGQIIKIDESLTGKIITTGQIQNREELNRLYSKSAIFALPSRWESFAIVMLEALSKGCYFIGTEGIAPIRDVIINDKLGKIVGIDKIDELSLAILDAVVSEKYYSTEQIIDRMQYVNNNFSWSVICRKIVLMLNGV